jgi:(4-(4-[2-(gamma-L-glutamylamino)ethyl]phenoxymethyl)furan-2-yl)methanamine synthase
MVPATFILGCPMIVGLDIGGANLKACAGASARSVPFELWRDPDGLGAALSGLLKEWNGPKRLAVTMTGELCDCFASRSDGVRRILASVAAAFRESEVFVYQTTGRLVSAAEAEAAPEATAAANWHAIASAASRFLPDQTGLVLDIGSTTTDLVPVRQGRPVVFGLTDFARLRAGELLYSGLLRTPVCAVTRVVRLGNRLVPLAAEFFATVGDARLVTGELVDEPSFGATADGRPADAIHARLRLARSVCSDPDELGPMLAELAAAILVRQEHLIMRAIRSLANRHPDLATNVLVAGGGEDLAAHCVAEALPGAQLVRLSEVLGPARSAAAAAWAVAALLSGVVSTQKEPEAAWPAGTAG